MLVALLVVGGLAGCGAVGAGGDAATAEPATIRLGALLPLSGGSSHSGEAMRDGAQLAIDEINATGGVLGRRVELVTADDACDPGTAATAAQQIVKQDIVVSVGGYCSSAVVPTLRIFRDAGIPMVIAQANSTDLIEPGYDSVFLICGTVRAEAEFAVDRMAKLGGKRLAVVHDGTSFPLTLADATVAVAAETKALTVAAEIRLVHGAPHFRPIADAVVRSGADIVYFTGYYTEANQLIKDLRGRAFPGRIVVGDGAADGPLLNDLTISESAGVYGTGLLFPELMPNMGDWPARFRAAYGSPPGSSTVEGYDAVKVAVDAIRRANDSSPAAIQSELPTTDVVGVSGRIAFRPDGTRISPTFLLLRAEGQSFVRDPLT